MSVNELVRVTYSAQAKRPAILGTKTILSGETFAVMEWQAKLARAQHPGLFTIQGQPEEAPAPLGDDLTMVKGIGEQTALRLRDMGVDSYAALASADPAEVARVAKKSISEVERWQLVAAELAEE